MGGGGSAETKPGGDGPKRSAGEVAADVAGDSWLFVLALNSLRPPRLSSGLRSMEDVTEFLRPECRERAALRLVCKGWAEVYSRAEVWSDVAPHVRRQSFRMCCWYHRPLAVQWLAAALRLTSEEVRKDPNYAFHNTCAHGHLELARWMAATFDLTAEDARAHGNCALRLSCVNGHLAMAQWLVETFGLTAEDARARDSEAVWWSCERGHPDIARWLAATFELEPHCEECRPR